MPAPIVSRYMNATKCCENTRCAPMGSAASGRAVKNGPVRYGGVTALHTAITGGNHEVVELPLRAGATVDAVDVRGMTPLMWAVATDRPEPRIARLLLAQGARRDLRSPAGESTIDWARKRPRPGPRWGAGCGTLTLVTQIWRADPITRSAL